MRVLWNDLLVAGTSAYGQGQQTGFSGRESSQHVCVQYFSAIR